LVSFSVTGIAKEEGTVVVEDEVFDVVVIAEGGELALLP
jgi:hypothetical protein